MSFTQSDEIYQQVLELHRSNDEMAILELLDEVDPRILDLSNIRILHMVHLYIVLKHTIKEYNFHDLLDELKTHNSRSRIIYDFWIEKITESVKTGSFKCKDLQEKIHTIDDLYFTLFFDSLYASMIYDDPLNFDKYLAEMKRIYMTQVIQDTDFNQIKTFKKNIHRTIIQYIDEKERFEDSEYQFVQKLEEKLEPEHKLNSDTEEEFEKSQIVAMINYIKDAVNKKKYDEATNRMSDFKNMYRTRSSEYFKSFLSRIQFEIKPSFKHAQEYYHSNDELSVLEDIPEISQYIKYRKIKMLCYFASTLRIAEKYTDLDSLNQLIDGLIGDVDGHADIDKYYQDDIKISKQIVHLTLVSQKSNIFDEYTNLLISLIDSTPHRINVNLLGDVVITWNKNIMENYKKRLIFTINIVSI